MKGYAVAGVEMSCASEMRELNALRESHSPFVKRVLGSLLAARQTQLSEYVRDDLQRLRCQFNVTVKANLAINCNGCRGRHDPDEHIPAQQLTLLVGVVALLVSTARGSELRMKGLMGRCERK